MDEQKETTKKEPKKDVKAKINWLNVLKYGAITVGSAAVGFVFGTITTKRRLAKKVASDQPMTLLKSKVA